ncbi:MAG: GNAT family protein [Pseudomonadota bacterium]
MSLSLTGARVTLRPFTADDVTDAYLGWLRDPRVTRFSNQRFRRHDRNSSLAYLGSFAGTENLFLSVRRRDDDIAIGTMTAYRSVEHGTIDVGILIGDPDSWGGGYGQDAWDTLTGWLLAQPGIRKLTAGTAAPNIGMVRLMERSGMTHEATRRAQEVIEGEPVDLLYYARFADR